VNLKFHAVRETAILSGCSKRRSAEFFCTRETDTCASKRIFAGRRFYAKSAMLKKVNDKSSGARSKPMRSYSERWRELMVGNLMLGMIAAIVMLGVVRC